MKLKIFNLINKKTTLALLAVFCTSVIGSWYFFSQTAAAQKTISIPPPTMTILDDRAIPEPPPELELPAPSPSNKDYATATNVSVLVIGYGGPGHQGGFLTDVIVQAHLDFSAQKLTLIHIPRDIWVSLPSANNSISTKINAALPMGLKVGNYPTSDIAKDTVIRGAYLTKAAVAQVTGIPVDLVIAIDFTRFSQAINALRGIDVTVTKTLDDPWYPVTGLELDLCGKTPAEVTHLSQTLSGFELEKQFPCRYEHLHFDAGVRHMDGSTALKFARSRHSTSDFDRGDRQIQILLGIQDKLFSLKALDNIPHFFTTLSKAVKTDLTQDIIVSLAPRLAQLPQFSQVKVGLSTDNMLTSTKTQTGAQALIPKAGQGNFGAIHAYIANQ